VSVDAAWGHMDGTHALPIREGTAVLVEKLLAVCMGLGQGAATTLVYCLWPA
jgi:hypothetical protein